jgi:hypothetical protein
MGEMFACVHVHVVRIVLFETRYSLWFACVLLKVLNGIVLVEGGVRAKECLHADFQFHIC